MKEKLLVIAHILLQLVAFISWLWLDWRIIAAVALLHIAMLEILKGCPLSHLQFNEKDKRFYEWELEEIGVRLTSAGRARLRIFMQYILPLIIVALAMLLQLTRTIAPLVG